MTQLEAGTITPVTAHGTFETLIRSSPASPNLSAMAKEPTVLMRFLISSCVLPDAPLRLMQGSRGPCRYLKCFTCVLMCLGFCWVRVVAAQQALPDAPNALPAVDLQSRTDAAQESEIAAVHALLASNALAAAEQRCRAALATYPRLPEIASLLGYILFREGEGRESLAAYTAAASLRKPQTEDLMTVAADYVLLGDYRSALHWFTRVTEQSPNDTLAWYYRARAELKLEIYSAALVDFEKTLALAPGDERAEDNLGLTYEALRDQAKAKACFEQAIAEEARTHSGYSPPFLNLGSLLLRADDPQGSLEPLRTAASMSPNNPTARQRLGEAYWSLHQDSAAEHELLAAVTEAPQAPSLHFLLGRVYHREGNQKAADKEFGLVKTLSQGAAPSEVPNRLGLSPSFRDTAGDLPFKNPTAPDVP